MPGSFSEKVKTAVDQSRERFVEAVAFNWILMWEIDT